MSEEPENVNETANEIINEETPEEVNKPKTEEVTKSREAMLSVANAREALTSVEQEIAKETTKEDEEQFKNKTDRLKNKKVKCEGCNMEMTLKTLRYSHKCAGKTEDKSSKTKTEGKGKSKSSCDTTYAK